MYNVYFSMSDGTAFDSEIVHYASLLAFPIIIYKRNKAQCTLIYDYNILISTSKLSFSNKKVPDFVLQVLEGWRTNQGWAVLGTLLRMG